MGPFCFITSPSPGPLLLYRNQAQRYERTEGRKDTRAGHYTRKLRTLPFETAIIERYRRRGSSVEEALIEMYLTGISVRRVEDITQALWGTRVSPSTVSNLNQKVYVRIEKWLNAPIEGKHPYVYLDGVFALSQGSRSFGCRAFCE